VHISQHITRWNLKQTSERPTIGSAVSERTAAVIWNMLDNIPARIFLWNVFPLHPHETGSPFTNRQHNSHERRAGEELLKELVSLLRPSRIVAIGNDAAAAADRISVSIPVVSVRHPSYGGQTQFQRQISALYGHQQKAGLLL
jgi:ABC-type Fe3+-hydroxamate transport system substrate-binding protein